MQALSVIPSSQGFNNNRGAAVVTSTMMLGGGFATSHTAGSSSSCSMNTGSSSTATAGSNSNSVEDNHDSNVSRGSLKLEEAINSARTCNDASEGSFTLHFTPDNSLSHMSGGFDYEHNDDDDDDDNSSDDDDDTCSDDDSDEYCSTSSSEETDDLIEEGQGDLMGIQRSPWEMAKEEKQGDEFFFFMPPKPVSAASPSSSTACATPTDSSKSSTTTEALSTSTCTVNKMFQKDSCSCMDEESDVSTTLVGDSDESEDYTEGSENSLTGDFSLATSIVGHERIQSDGFEQFRHSPEQRTTKHRDHAATTTAAADDDDDDDDEHCPIIRPVTHTHFSSLSPFAGLAPIEEVHDEDEEEEEEDDEEEEQSEREDEEDKEQSPPPDEQVANQDCSPIHRTPTPPELKRLDLPPDAVLPPSVQQQQQQQQLQQDASPRKSPNSVILDNHTARTTCTTNGQYHASNTKTAPRVRTTYSVLEQQTSKSVLFTQRDAIECLHALAFYL